MEARRRERLAQLARVALAALGAKGLCLTLFLLASSDARIEEYREFLALRAGETRGARLEAIQAAATERLAPFDGQFYLDITWRGYRRFDDWPHGNFAFFPLYPSLLFVLDALGGPTILIAALVHLMLSAASCVCLWVLAERLGTPPWIPVALILAWPGGAFHVLVYNESLFLFVSTLTAALSLHGRHRIAGAAGLLAGLTRPQGVLVSLLLLPLVRARPVIEPRRWLVALTPVAGLLFFMLVLELQVGSPLAFLEVQESWGRSPAPFAVALAFHRAMALEGLLPDCLTAIGGILMIPVLFWRLPLPLALFGAASVLMPLSTGTPLSMCRFLSVAFPLFLALGSLLSRRPGVAAGVILLEAVVQAWFIQRLAHWEFAG